MKTVGDMSKSRIKSKKLLKEAELSLRNSYEVTGKLSNGLYYKGTIRICVLFLDEAIILFSLVRPALSLLSLDKMEKRKFLLTLH